MSKSGTEKGRKHGKELTVIKVEQVEMLKRTEKNARNTSTYL